MNIPEELKIGGHTFTVGEHDFKASVDRAFVNVWCNHISLLNDETITESSKAEHLLHEIIEAIVAMHELELEHHMISTLSEQLFQVLRDNDIDFRGDE